EKIEIELNEIASRSVKSREFKTPTREFENEEEIDLIEGEQGEDFEMESNRDKIDEEFQNEIKLIKQHFQERKFSSVKSQLDRMNSQNEKTLKYLITFNKVTHSKDNSVYLLRCLDPKLDNKKINKDVVQQKY